MSQKVVAISKNNYITQVKLGNHGQWFGLVMPHQHDTAKMQGMQNTKLHKFLPSSVCSNFPVVRSKIFIMPSMAPQAM